MEEEYTAEEALAKVREMFFPAAQNGDTVEQFGYLFVMEDNEWNHQS
tara:strand:- start:504 stop:644 length:141 start_codon:yes stop_codon:yes gene_type:complete